MHTATPYAPFHPFPARDGDGPPRLSWGSLWLCLTVSLSVFTFLGGPIWNGVWDIQDVTHRILCSYLVIPIAVLVCLAAERKLRLSSLFFETLKLAVVKFVLTFMTMNTVWAISERPAVAASDTVMDATPIESALESFVLSPPSEPVVLHNDGYGFTPAVAVVQVGQPVVFSSDDGHLHSAKGIALADGRPAFNYAIPARGGGAGREITFRRALGVVDIRCRVHPGESVAHLIVVDDPFFATHGEIHVEPGESTHVSPRLDSYHR
jgi:plastocyanin